MVRDLPPKPEPGEAAILEQNEIPPGEPVYVIPPIELEPEITFRADQLAEQRDWGHGPLGLVELHGKGYKGEGEIVAICDTGGDPDHPDLKARFLPDGHKDYTGSRYGWRDVQGHGTHCSGISLASMDGSVGVIGAAPEAKLLIQKVLGDRGSGASSWIAAGIRNAADLNAGVISLSLGGGSPDTQTRSAIQYATSKGAWVVAAAGNDGGPATSYPGHYPETIAVAALDSELRRASFSTINQQNDVATPGVSILSTLPDNRYGRMSGTSMATPYVAGCLALVRSAVKKAGRPIPSQTELMAAFPSLCRDLGAIGHDSSFGWGMPDTAKMIEHFAGPVSPPVPPVPPVPPAPILTHNIRGYAKPDPAHPGEFLVSLNVWKEPVTAVEPAAPRLDLAKLIMIGRAVLEIYLLYQAGNIPGMIARIEKLLRDLGWIQGGSIEALEVPPWVIDLILEFIKKWLENRK